MLTFANAAASVITTRKGALRVMPTRDEIQNLLGIISYRLYPEHYFCRENTIFIGKVTGTAVFVGNVADRFDSCLQGLSASHRTYLRIVCGCVR